VSLDLPDRRGVHRGKLTAKPVIFPSERAVHAIRSTFFVLFLIIAFQETNAFLGLEDEAAGAVHSGPPASEEVEGGGAGGWQALL
jgi:hypothetical protein